MTDQTRWGIPEVQLKNRARNYDKQNTTRLHEAQDIFKEPHDYLQYMAECGENIDGY